MNNQKNVSNPSLLEVIEALATVFEERVLDENCAKNNMKWDIYIRKIILEKWTPDNFSSPHWLDCYRKAIEKLKKSDKTTTGSFWCWK
jgi:hypothetical protein